MRKWVAGQVAFRLWLFLSSARSIVLDRPGRWEMALTILCPKRTMLGLRAGWQAATAKLHRVAPSPSPARAITATFRDCGSVNFEGSNILIDTAWWKRGIIYQIYPRSFQDSNGDGVGDLNGIRQRLSYLTWLGIDAIWISPIYPSPMADFGYDITDYCNIDPVFGTIADFDALLREGASAWA